MSTDILACAARSQDYKEYKECLQTVKPRGLASSMAKAVDELADGVKDALQTMTEAVCKRDFTPPTTFKKRK